MKVEDIDLGQWVEGTVILDPTKGRYIVLGTVGDGTRASVDPQEVLASYAGQQVRMIITPLSTVARLAALVEGGEVPIEQASYRPPKGS